MPLKWFPKPSIWQYNDNLLLAKIHFNSEGPKLEPSEKPTTQQSFFETIIQWFRDLFNILFSFFR